MTEPALTPEEWGRKALYAKGEGREHEFWDDGWVEVQAYNGEHHMADLSPRRHGIAALCLHGQPFGFTREDVKLLREGIVHEQAEYLPVEATRISDLADRIEALLPPDATGGDE